MLYESCNLLSKLLIGVARLWRILLQHRTKQASESILETSPMVCFDHLHSGKGLQDISTKILFIHTQNQWTALKMHY